MHVKRFFTNNPIKLGRYSLTMLYNLLIVFCVSFTRVPVLRNESNITKMHENLSRKDSVHRAQFQYYIQRATPNIAIRKPFSKRVRIKAWLLPNVPRWEAKPDELRLWPVLISSATRSFFSIACEGIESLIQPAKLYEKILRKGGYTNYKCNTVAIRSLR